MNSRRKPDADPLSGIVCGATGLRGSWYFLHTSKVARTLAAITRRMLLPLQQVRGEPARL